MNLPFFIGLRYTGAKRKSQLVSFLSAVSMSGLIVGVALLLLVLSVMNGFDRELREQILGLVPQAAVMHREGIEDWQSLKAKMEMSPGVKAAAPFVKLQGLVSHQGETSAVTLFGIDPEAERSVSLITKHLNAEQMQRLDNENGQIFLGVGIADKLKVEVGQSLLLVVPNGDGKSPQLSYFTLGGIIESKTELDGALAITSLGQASELSTHPGRVTGIRLKLHDLFDAPKVVYSELVQLGQGYYGTNWTRTHGNLYHAIHMSKQLVGLLMLLIVGIAAFNVVSTLVMVVVDKQGDIAILRTLGAGSNKIMAIFMVQGSLIGVIGTSVGVIVGCLLSFGIKGFVGWIESALDIKFLHSDVYPLTYLPTQILLSDVLYVAGTALGLSFLATLYPAWRASRVQPAEALRYE